MSFDTLLVVIPTRNRAEFAMRAISSVLSQENCSVEVLVSDNSTEENEVSKLHDYCKGLADQRLRYIRPTQSLPMSQHWNWIMEQTRNLYSISHVTYLTDRMMFVDGSLSEIQNILMHYGDKVVSYSTDGVNDSCSPVVLHQIRWSGKVFEIESSSIIKQFAETRMIYHPTPRMINCVVPLNILNEIHRIYGNYFSSVAPDFNFAFRALDLLESIIFYDKAILIQFGTNRSNGANLLKGIMNKDGADFLKNLDTSKVDFETPVADLYIMPNTILHEYYKIKQIRKSVKFPEINREKYFTSLVGNIYSYRNLELREEMKRKIQTELSKYLIFKYLVKSYMQTKFPGLKIKLHNLLHPSDHYFLQKNFETLELAIEYANKFPRSSTSERDLADERFGAFGKGAQVLQNYVGAGREN